ncbi:MAG: Zn-dependent hydrolase [Chloroflexota bacterium]|nr:Zn-dependent hydrolase [Chloroflexota bacterium]
MIDVAALPIDATELQARIDQLGGIGTHPEGGLYRALYDDGWVEAMVLVRTWLEELGMTTRFDAVGNLWGRLDGSAGGEAVVTGSHIDTVRQGGKYDGALGIHVAIAAVKALVAAHGTPRRPLEILVVCEEEGSRFSCNFWGARAIVGRIEPGEPERAVDPSGVTIGQAMRERGFNPRRIGEAERRDIAAFLECHIEQGAILEREGYPLGVVSTITGSHWMGVRVTGRQDHAGTTPMDLRRDPVAGAAQMIERVTAAATRMGWPAVATVGRVAANPGAINVVPGWCEFTIDTRHAEPEPRRELLSAIQTILKDVARERDLGLDVQPIADHDPVPMSPEIRGILEDVIREMGARYLVMPSGAGHDSEILAARFPTAMLFVPSRYGRSHTPDEFTSVEQIVPGVRGIAGALHRLAY